ncbi:putative hydrophobic protein (TIGR00271 family) [Allocatelliglobosispora scoriae]|uniref:Putative hydrophobic protein (TIGR00271 family) n=1 Tax=Allocatelliglobosispora scoriae TaxID=643052 RepID=A0A841BMU6_9ACTN|nr:DUF389 domain-containing protein [Allocatelliglobosispora scoriae]MBB5868072.1 putative hydrophobic protein (TIGR00271 family) [Allocatelliglobosispora scoriae]
MLHLRIITPTDLTERVVKMLEAELAVTHVVVLPAAARQPPGDLVLCDVAREGANEVLDELRALGVDSRGAVTAEDMDLVLSASAKRAARAAPGLGADAVVWEEIAQKTGEETRLSATYLVFLCVATVIAGIGVLLDQPILIVGAMVVGPEFGPLAALCLGLVQRRRTVVTRSLVTLVVGFAVAMAVTVLTTWILTWLGLVDEAMLTAPRPLTDFIWRPDALSWVIAFLAGVAGMLSLTSAKSGALIGVLISVTTVPAAANAAVALAYGVTHEAWGSAVQLLVNLTAIVVAGIITLAVQRLWWKRPSVNPTA